ncbi:hypothetical protein N7467_000922 [Penicillium canescens]|nr:hypothetical protein N7467_000922 [Penicillium canescens]
MSPRGTMSWSEREEENLLRWLDENRALPSVWTEALNHYVAKSTICCGRKVAPMPDLRKGQDRRKRPAPSRRSVGMRASQSDAPVKAAAQSNIDLWFQTILTAEPSPTGSRGSTLTRGSISDRLTPALTNSLPKKSRTSSWIWEYVHRVCATGKLDL